MNDHHPIEASSISTEDAKLLSKLRAHRRTHRKKLIPEAPDQVGHFAVTPPTRGQLLADLVARTVGSWRFIIFQSTAIVAWIVGNVMMAQSAWDPYPFILLNLLLSFQAAYTAPAIMMSQNRQSELDRRHAQATTRSTSKPNWRLSCCTKRSTFCANRSWLPSPKPSRR